MRILFWVIAAAISFEVSASEKLNLPRRWVVFPFAVENELRASADNAWWKSREVLTVNKRFLVASRQFLLQKDVYQPRKTLKSEDISVLGKLLEADMIVTGVGDSRRFQLYVYLVQSGGLFWTKVTSFQPGADPASQLEVLVPRMMQELVRNLPFHGFTITDPLIGKVVFEDGPAKLAIVDVGNSDNLSTQTDLQWVEVILPDKPNPDTPLLFQAKLAVVGEGRVSKVRRGVVVAEILRAGKIEDLTEKTMVRIPKLADGDPDPFLTKTDQEKKQIELMPTQINPVTSGSETNRRTATFFGSLITFLGILVLAF